MAAGPEVSFRAMAQFWIRLLGLILLGWVIVVVLVAVATLGLCWIDAVSC